MISWPVQIDSHLVGDLLFGRLFDVAWRFEISASLNRDSPKRKVHSAKSRFQGQQRFYSISKPQTFSFNLLLRADRRSRPNFRVGQLYDLPIAGGNGGA